MCKPMGLAYGWVWKARGLAWMVHSDRWWSGQLGSVHMIHEWGMHRIIQLRACVRFTCGYWNVLVNSMTIFYNSLKKNIFYRNFYEKKKNLNLHQADLWRKMRKQCKAICRFFSTKSPLVMMLPAICLSFQSSLQLIQSHIFLSHIFLLYLAHHFSLQLFLSFSSACLEEPI